MKLKISTDLPLQTTTQLTLKRYNLSQKRICFRYTAFFIPALPQEKITSIQTISVGVEGKIILLFDTPWYTRPNWPFYLWRGVEKDQISVEDKWMTRIIEGSKPMGFSHGITLWTTGDRAKVVGILTIAAILVFLLDVFALTQRHLMNT